MERALDKGGLQASGSVQLQLKGVWGHLLGCPQADMGAL